MLRLSKEEVNPGPVVPARPLCPTQSLIILPPSFSPPRHSALLCHSKSPRHSLLDHSPVSLCVIPAKAGIQSLLPLCNALVLGGGRAGVLGPSSGFPLKTAGMTGGQTAGVTGWMPVGRTGGGRREGRGG